MKSKALLFYLLSVFYVLCGVSDALATTKVASTTYIDNRIAPDSGGNLQIKNDEHKTVTLSHNSQTTAITPDSTQVATVGWTDANRTSKVRAGSDSSTDLVDMWVE